MLSILIMTTGMLSILIMTTGMLSILIMMEFISLGLFLLMITYFYPEGVLELMIFLIFLVSEALLGLVLLIVKVLVSGDDMIEISDVF